MVGSGKKLPVYDDSGTCTNYSSIMAITIMMVSLAVCMFENLELLVNLNLSLLGKAAGTHFSGGLNLDIDFLILGLATDNYLFGGENNGQHYRKSTGRQRCICTTLTTLMIHKIGLKIVEI